MAKEPTLVSHIEWEHFGGKWEIKELKPSQMLPEGAEKVEVWRSEDYGLKAKLYGTIEPERFDLHPKVKMGALIPLFDVEGNDEYGLCDYEIGSCALGSISFGMRNDQTSNSPVRSYEADVFTPGARWNSRHVDPSDAEWLSEWYLNGPRERFIYRRGSITRLNEKYERERNLPGNKTDAFEDTKRIGGASFNFVETDRLSFLVQHTPEGVGPSWSECLSIEYRPAWGGIPDTADREAIGALVGFLVGRELINVGHTRFAADGWPISQVAVSPPKDNLVSLCQKPTELKPVDIDNLRSEKSLESLLVDLTTSYLSLKEELRLNEALRCYWLSAQLPVGLNLPVLSVALETLARSWFESKNSKTGGVYMTKKAFDALLGQELDSAAAKLNGQRYGDRILNRLRGAYNMGANESLRFFFDEIALEVGNTEWDAIKERNPMAHGAPSVFDGSTNVRMIEATRTYQTLFHRIMLKLLGYNDSYVDYGTLGFPIRPIDEPSGTA